MSLDKPETGPLAASTSRRPDIDGAEALQQHSSARIAAANLSIDPITRPAPVIASNGEEDLYAANPLSSFTKGLPHDRFGRVDQTAYDYFVSALLKVHPMTEQGGFPAPLGPTDDPDKSYPVGYTPKDQAVDPDQGVMAHFQYLAEQSDGRYSKPALRKWESPQGGLNTDLMGPSPAGVAMPPAPTLGSSELCAEMAEVYAMALVRDVALEDIQNDATTVEIDSATNFSIGELVAELGKLSWFDPDAHPTSSVPAADGGPAVLNAQERKRRAARLADGDTTLTARALFRGSTAGAHTGPYLSQFMLTGSKGRAEGKIAFGTQDIDQRSHVEPEGLDYMSNWSEWLDVQNGAKHNGPHGRTTSLRYLTTPRDLASYVHQDQLYQAYFNAALLLMERGMPFDPGLPNAMKPKLDGAPREGFATYGGPHLLSLFAEVASRGLKAVRRQKFQIHRRARPEVIAAQLSLGLNGHMAALGDAADKVGAMIDELTEKTPKLLHWIDRLNARHTAEAPESRGLTPASKTLVEAPDFPNGNIMLPMAFPEGSPMHPAYGAGHATVAGACVTILKAFFDMHDGWDKADWPHVPDRTLEAAGLPGNLVGKKETLGTTTGTAAKTITGELDKLAANISIARNMAGVHFYTDYYESLRMGERVAIGILQEQMLTSPESVAMHLTDFDGNRLRISTEGRGNSTALAATRLEIENHSPHSWWIANLGDYLPAGA